MKNIWIICGLNASRSQVIEEFLSKKYSDVPGIEIKSAGLDVHLLREDDKKILFTREMAKEADIIFVSDNNKFYRVRYNLLNNDKKDTEKIHLLRIPDIFHIHRNAAINKQKYDGHMKRILEDSDFSRLRGYIEALSPKEASILTEAIYIKELYTDHLSPELRQDKKYPFELLYKTLEFRLPWISQLIENTKS